MRTFSPGACGPTISGPIETISTPRSFWPRTAHSSPPWTTVSVGSDAEEPFEGRLRRREQRRVEVGLPWRIRAPYLDLRAAEAPERVHRREHPSSAAAFELRVIEPSVRAPSAVAAVVRLVLVSTAPCRPGVIARTPFGSAETRSSTRRVVDGSATVSVSAGLDRHAPRSPSVPACPRTIAASSSSRAARSAGSDSAGDDDHCPRLSRDGVSTDTSVERDEPERRRPRGRRRARVRAP